MIFVESSLFFYNIYQFSVDAEAQLVSQQTIGAGTLRSLCVKLVYYIDNSYILLLFERKSSPVLVSCLTGELVNDFHVPHPTISNVVTPFLGTNKVEWIFWAASALKSTYDGLRIKCSSMPNNLLNTFSSEYLGYFEPRKKEVIAIKRRDGILVAEIIPFSVHRLNLIDCVSYQKCYLETIYMILWSKESSLSIILSHGAKGTWVVKENVDWSCGPIIESFTFKQYLVPKVYSTSTNTHVDIFLLCDTRPECNEIADESNLMIEY